MFRKLLIGIVVMSTLLIGGCSSASDDTNNHESELTYEIAYEKFDELYVESKENPNTSISNLAFMSMFLSNTFTSFNNKEVWGTEKDSALVYEVANDWFLEHSLEIYQDTTHGAIHIDDINFISETLDLIDKDNNGELNDVNFNSIDAKKQLNELSSIYMDAYSEQYDELNN